MSGWQGRGKGRLAGQPTITSRGSWSGHGKGRDGSQPSLDISGGPGKGGGRDGAQASISSSGAFTGRGQGRSGSQPTIETGSQLGTRSTQSTTAWTNGGGSHVADPEGNYIFALEIDSIEVAQFLECSGLKSTTDVFELEEGGMNHRVHKLPGQSRWENVVLRYGVTNDVSMLQWRDEILQGEFGAGSRRNGAIIVKNNQMEVVRRYEFVDAWPVSWEGPNFASSGADLAIETVELAHHGITVA